MGSGILGKFSGVAHIVETNWPSGPDHRQMWLIFHIVIFQVIRSILRKSFAKVSPPQKKIVIFLYHFSSFRKSKKLKLLLTEGNFFGITISHSYTAWLMIITFLLKFFSKAFLIIFICPLHSEIGRFTETTISLVLY